MSSICNKIFFTFYSLCLIATSQEAGQEKPPPTEGVRKGQCKDYSISIFLRRLLFPIALPPPKMTAIWQSGGMCASICNF